MSFNVLTWSYPYRLQYIHYIRRHVHTCQTPRLRRCAPSPDCPPSDRHPSLCEGPGLFCIQCVLCFLAVQNSSIGDLVTHWVTHWPFDFDMQRATPETCDLWDIWNLEQLRTWDHDNLCDLTFKSDTGQHSQFLCFLSHWTWHKPKCLVIGSSTKKLS